MTLSARVDYDAIAHFYDTQPYREKTVDPELLAFIRHRGSSDPLSILDIGCGTGNQLVANRSVVSHARLVGLDRSLGMLHQAQRKAPDIAWVQADGAAPPFEAHSFDFATCQYALHHMRDTPGVLRAVFRILRLEGRLVLHNLCPQECADWLCYEYFPEAHAIDVQHFWPLETMAAVMEATGFTAVTVERQHLRYQQNLLVWLDTVRRRDTCSQLMAIPDASYRAGICRLERELADASAPRVRADHLCLATIRGDKRTR